MRHAVPVVVRGFAILLLSFTTAWAQPSDATRVLVVSYVEVVPASEAQAGALLKTFRGDLQQLS